MGSLCFEFYRDEYGSKPRRTGTVYVDAPQSCEAFEAPVECFVIIRGCKYLVGECRALEAMNGNVHHWELGIAGADE